MINTLQVERLQFNFSSILSRTYFNIRINWKNLLWCHESGKYENLISSEMCQALYSNYWKINHICLFWTKSSFFHKLPLWNSYLNWKFNFYHRHIIDNLWKSSKNYSKGYCSVQLDLNKIIWTRRILSCITISVLVALYHGLVKCQWAFSCGFQVVKKCCFSSYFFEQSKSFLTDYKKTFNPGRIFFFIQRYSKKLCSSPTEKC